MVPCIDVTFGLIHVKQHDVLAETGYWLVSSSRAFGHHLITPEESQWLCGWKLRKSYKYISSLSYGKSSYWYGSALLEELWTIWRNISWSSDIPENVNDECAFGCVVKLLAGTAFAPGVASPQLCTYVDWNFKLNILACSSQYNTRRESLMF